MPKIKPVIKKRLDRKMSIAELQDTEAAITSQSTLKGYRSALNKINDHFGWDRDIIYYDRLDKASGNMVETMGSLWNFTNLNQVKQRLSCISSLMTRSFGGDHRIKSVVRTLTRDVSMASIKKDENIPKWEDLLIQLNKIAGSGHTNVGIIAKIFSYGYVLRVGEIFTTRLTDDGKGNFLDLDNHVWTIRNQKNGKIKIFDVEPELCQWLPKDRTWLIRKSNGLPYGVQSHRLSYHGWTLPDNRICRKSYETWNCNRSGRSDEEKSKWHTILGHSKQTVQDYYDADLFKE